MKREDFARAYEPLPQALEHRVRYTLEHLDGAKAAPAGRLTLRTSLIVLALVVAMSGVAYAVFENKTAALFGWFYGEDMKTELENGDVAVMAQSTQVGDVVFTAEEMVYKHQGDFRGLYGVIRVAPAEGAKVMLVAEDASVDDPAGYVLHYGDTALPDDAPSYAELAEESGAQLISPRAFVSSLMVDGVDYSGCVGIASLPQEDGSVLITLEMTENLPRSDSYALVLSLTSTPLTQTGSPDREAEKAHYDWSLTVAPDMKEE